MNRHRLEVNSHHWIQGLTASIVAGRMSKQFRTLCRMLDNVELSFSSEQILTPQPKLSEQEEINRLMEAALAEAKLDNSEDGSAHGKATADRDLEDRLLRLKGIDPGKHLI